MFFNFLFFFFVKILSWLNSVYNLDTIYFQFKKCLSLYNIADWEMRLRGRTTRVTFPTEYVRVRIIKFKFAKDDSSRMRQWMQCRTRTNLQRPCSQVPCGPQSRPQLGCEQSTPVQCPSQTQLPDSRSYVPWSEQRGRHWYTCWSTWLHLSPCQPALQ